MNRGECGPPPHAIRLPRHMGDRVWPVVLLIAMLLSAIGLAVAASVDAAASPTPAIGAGPETLADPPMVGGQPVVVAVSLRIANISEIKEVEEQFNLDGYLFADWRDPRLAYAAVPGAPPRTYLFGEIWTPKLDFVNEVNPRKIYDRSLNVDPDGTVHMVERTAAVLSSMFELRSFPFDTQHLLIVIHPFVPQARQIAFTLRGSDNWMSTDFGVYSSLAEWRISAASPFLHTIDVRSIGPISEITFTLIIRRNYEFYIWKVMLPLLLMVMLSWSVFWIETFDLQNQIQVAVVTLLTVIAFALALSSELPKVPYLTFIDVYFLTCYIFVFIAMVELMTVHVARRVRGDTPGLRIRKVSRWIVPLAFWVVLGICAVHFLA